MQERIRAVVNEGRIESLDKLDLPDGTQVLVTVLPNGDDFLLRASEVSLNAIWDNCEDDIYAELLETSIIKSGGNDEHLRRNN